MGPEVRSVFLIYEPLACVVDVVIVVLQSQGTPLYVVESREGCKHLMHNRHVEKLSLSH